MLDPLREHRETKIDVPATCPIGGNGEGNRRTAAEAIKAQTSGSSAGLSVEIHAALTW